MHNLDVATYNAQKAAFNVTFQETIAATLDNVVPEYVSNIQEEGIFGGRVWANADGDAPQCSMTYRLSVFDSQVDFSVLRAQLVEATSTGAMDANFRHYAGLHGIDNSSYFGEAKANLHGGRSSSRGLTGPGIVLTVVGVVLAVVFVGALVAFYLLREKEIAGRAGPAAVKSDEGVPAVF